ncbi:hypothetical protein ONZ51_g2075 [Trametes cubensis]|uniref:Uncharacterized protein n=1 Tax=Trametes cubensis TaxID=1111947 RepID=A0AAD7U0A1_9APHY|nr:hypothetical protein ONZ51_g2075 [Trametes cubensis]
MMHLLTFVLAAFAVAQGAAAPAEDVVTVITTEVVVPTLETKFFTTFVTETIGTHITESGKVISTITAVPTTLVREEFITTTITTEEVITTNVPY